jgi:DNA repair protein SbcD/Mre11
MTTKLLHTADWHLGKLLKNASRMDDQRDVLEQIVASIIREKPDAVLLAGDIYDRPVPSAGAVEIFDEFMHRIVIELQTPVVAIAGNHDSAERIDCYSGLLRRQGLHIAGVPRLDESGCEPVCIKGTEIFTLPFVEPEQYRVLASPLASAPASGIRTHADVVSHYIEHLGKHHNLSKPSTHAVFVAHCFVTGANVESEGDGERSIGAAFKTSSRASSGNTNAAVGGVELVPKQHFAPFSYTALGHIHRPQQFIVASDIASTQGLVRYAGSPLRYSFSEIGYEKSITIVEFSPNEPPTARIIPLLQQREVRVVEGHIENRIFSLADGFHAGANDFLKVRLSNPTLVVEPMQTIQHAFPNVLDLEYIKKPATSFGTGAEQHQRLLHEQIAKLTPAELFADFYRAMLGESLPDGAQSLLNDCIAAAEKVEEKAEEKTEESAPTADSEERD